MKGKFGETLRFLLIDYHYSILEKYTSWTLMKKTCSYGNKSEFIY